MLNIKDLNENQQMAVNHLNGPCMVLAGPGSGKTRVITYRIINMIQNYNIHPRNILAISFTKASSTEMRERAEKLSSDNRISNVTYGTFHSVFFRILRHFDKYDLNSILDEKTKRYTVRNILKALNVENGEDDDVISSVIGEISYVKNELMEASEFDSNTLTKDEFTKTYKMYEDYKSQMKKIDFDDMLIVTYELLKGNEAALNRVRSVYKYILVDEFQDINKVQFEVIKLIASPINNIFVVGDEDQSIYGFRGSRPDFLLEFEEYFEGSKKIVLDINYRSKKDIINIANKLILNNKNRYDKVIKCFRNEECVVDYITPKDSEDEAIQIAKDIEYRAKNESLLYSDFAVIYRTNIQSRALVDVFMDRGIPFIVKDSVVTIYDHWVAKDVLAYLRLAINKNIKEDWIKIINRPFRYISKDSVKIASEEPDFIKGLREKCDLHLKQLKTIDDLESDLDYISSLAPKYAISYIRTSLEYDRYIMEYCDSRKIKTTPFVEVLNEIESASVHFETIREYLDHIERVKEEMVDNKKQQITDGVVFTTMHSAKGLEFKNVYLIGATEGTIPHEKSCDIEDDIDRMNAIEEERRLLYVGLTRAMDNLYISVPKEKYGKKVFSSRFVDEMKAISTEKIKEIRRGDKIYHKHFKEGTIIEQDGSSVEIKFKNGIKKLNLLTCLKNNIITKIK